MTSINPWSDGVRPAGADIAAVKAKTDLIPVISIGDWNIDWGGGVRTIAKGYWMATWDSIDGTKIQVQVTAGVWITISSAVLYHGVLFSDGVNVRARNDSAATFHNLRLIGQPWE